MFTSYDSQRLRRVSSCLFAQAAQVADWPSLMRYEDQLRAHSGYFKGSLAAIELYVRIHDHPDLTEEKLSALVSRFLQIIGVSS